MKSSNVIGCIGHPNFVRMFYRLYKTGKNPRWLMRNGVYFITTTEIHDKTIGK